MKQESAKRVFIYGSCVSRDVFTFDNDCDFELVNYVARSPMASALSNKPMLEVDIEGNDSAFQRKMLFFDLEKRLLHELDNCEFDFLLVDLIDERINLIRTKNEGLVAYSNELLRTGYKFREEDGELISGFSTESFAMWENAWAEFIDFARKKEFFEKIRVIEVYWARCEAGLVAPGYTDESLRLANEWLENAYKRVRSDLPENQIIYIPKELCFADPEHIWGFSPFHYMKKYYLHVLSFLKKQSYNEEPSFPHAEVSKAIGPSAVKKLGCHGLHFSCVTEGDSFSVRLEIDKDELGDDTKLLIGFGAIDTCDEFIRNNALVKSHVGRIGYYKYLKEVGIGWYEADFECRSGTNIDFRVFVYNQEEISIKGLDFVGLRVHDNRKLYPLISVDVEALPHRAPSNHIDTLVFGNVSDGVYGVRRLCEIFKEFGIAGTFFVEVAGALLYGEDYLYKVRDIVFEFGQDVGLHIHPEIFKKVPFPNLKGGFSGFSDIGYSDAVTVLAYCKDLYTKIFGISPASFRPGAMQISAEMYKACEDLGLTCVSGFFRGHWEHLAYPSIENGCFQWENDIIEVPLDLALDPLKSVWGGFEKYIAKKRSSSARFKFVSLLIHSWSLLARNESGYHEDYSSTYETVLKEYIAKLSYEYDFITHGDAIDMVRGAIVAPTQVVPISLISKNKLSLSFDCSDGLVWREIGSDDVKSVNDLIPAMCLPISTADPSCLHYFSDGKVVCPVYVSGGRARILSNRVPLDSFAQLLYSILQAAPGVTVSANKQIVDDTLRNSRINLKKSGEAFYIFLPSSFDEFRERVISKNLRYEIERECRKHEREGCALDIRFQEKGEICYERFCEVFGCINRRLEAKGAKGYDNDWMENNYELFRSRGLIVELLVDQQQKGVGVFLLDKGVAHYYAAAIGDHESGERSVSYGKILLYFSIKRIIESQIATVNLGGGDYGYKQRFGGVSVPLYDIEFNFEEGAVCPENAAFYLIEKKSINLVEESFGGRLEQLFGYRFFDRVLGLDFDASVSVSELGLDSTAKAYTASIDSAIYGLLDLVPSAFRGLGFADIGCGKGKVLYYVQPYKFSRYLGVELSTYLCGIARRNLDALGLKDVVVENKSAASLTSDEVRGIGVYFLYNPFNRYVMEEFVRGIVNASRNNNEPICVCYLNSVHGDVFDEMGFRTIAIREKGVDQWRFDNSAVYVFGGDDS